MAAYSSREAIRPTRAGGAPPPAVAEGASRARIVPVAGLCEVQKDEMYALLESYYSNVTRDQFDRDLAEKEWVVLGTLLESGRVCGFSTLMRLRATVEGRRILAFYSGDTIVATPFWGRDTAKGIGLLVRHMIQCAREEPDREPVWYLVSSTWKSSRLLPLLFRVYEPSPDGEFPADSIAILKELTKVKFGTEYHTHRSIVRFPNPSVYRFNLAHSPEPDDDPGVDEHIALFLERNSGWREGDRLVSLARVTVENLSPLGRRLVCGQEGALPLASKVAP